jgi:single-strand DNA-binding protein
MTLIGNLGKDAELKRTPSGAEYTVFTLATNESYKDRNGEWQSETEWHYVKVWGRSAERASQQLKKGAKVYVEGKLKSYEVDGVRRYEVSAHTWRSLDSKQHNDLAPGDLLPPGPQPQQFQQPQQTWKQPPQNPTWVSDKPY